MGEVYVYGPNTTLFDSMGLCGALSPESCLHTEARNDISEVVLKHPIDDHGRWSFLQLEYLVKCDVPVRTAPPVGEDGVLVTTHEIWTIKTGMTKTERNLYYNETGDKVRKKAMPAGTQLRIVAKGDSRHKALFIKVERRRGKLVEKPYYGWINKDAILYTLDDPRPDDPADIETVAPAWTVADQLFRIYKVDLTDEGVTAYARHIFYDLMYYVSLYTTTPVTCVDALAGIMSSAAANGFKGHTNIGDERVLDKGGWTRVNTVNAILDPETGVVGLWGGELVRDNYDFYILREAGLNRGVRIEYAKNMLGVSCEMDISDVITRVIPVGKDKKGNDLLLVPGDYNVDGTIYHIGTGETWIDSPHINDYTSPRIKVLQCSGACKETKDLSQAAVRVRMIREALEALANDADLPKVTLKVTFVALGDTEEYAQFRNLEDLFLYDYVRIRHPAIQVDILAEVNRVEFNCLTEKFEAIEVGTVRLDMKHTTIAKWQLPYAIDGAKIAMETLLAAQMEQDSVDEYDLSNNGSVQTVAENVVGLVVAITASQGFVLTSDIDESVLEAHIMRGATDLTASFDASRFKWTRTSADTTGDAAWNAAHTTGTKTVTITRTDITQHARFTCVLEEA